MTGSHLNNNLHEGLGPGRDCPKTPERFDFDAYLDLLTQRGHNFIRLWRWEQFRGYLAPADVHLCMRPQPWPRTGPGPAKDGKPKFDLSTFDQTYFDRLRSRIVAAGRGGISASVMLFEDFSLHMTAPADNVEGHPFHAANNVNDIEISSILDYQVLRLHPAPSRSSTGVRPQGHRHRSRPSQRFGRGRQRIVGAGCGLHSAARRIGQRSRPVVTPLIVSNSCPT